MMCIYVYFVGRATKQSIFKAHRYKKQGNKVTRAGKLTCAGINALHEHSMVIFAVTVR